jgi:hypothetical protein
MAEPSDPANTSDKKPATAASDTKKPEKSSESAAKSGASVTSGGKKEDAKADSNPGSKGKSSSVPGSGSSKPSDSQATSQATSQAKSEDSGGGGRAFLVLVVVVALIGGGAFATRGMWMPKIEPYLAGIPGFGTATSEPEQAAQPDKAAPPEQTTPSEPAETLSERLASLEKSFAESGNVDSVMSALKEEKARTKAELDKALARIDDLETRLAEVRSLASAVTSSAGGEVDLTPILSRIDGLEEAGRETSGDVAALTEKVENISATGSGSAGSGVVLAIAQLRDAAYSGRPYSAQLSALKSVANGNPDVLAAASRLDAGADKGLPTVEALQSSFADIGSDIVAQARAGDGDWLEQASGRLSALVSLRRTDGASGNPVEDAVAKIEQDLAARDIAAAVRTGEALADTLKAAAKATFDPWLIDAKARATATRALDAMHASALAGLDK